MKYDTRVKKLEAPSAVLKEVKPEVEAFMEDIGGVR